MGGGTVSRHEYPPGPAYSISENATRRSANTLIERLRSTVVTLEARVLALTKERERDRDRHHTLTAKYDELRLKVKARMPAWEKREAYLEDIISAYCDEHGGVSETRLASVRDERAVREATTPLEDN